MINWKLQVFNQIKQPTLLENLTSGKTLKNLILKF